MTSREKPLFELSGWQHAAVFLFACLLVISRKPDAVLHAQFCGEDGHVFFADAYNLGGWSAMFRAYAGSLHAVPRIGAALALLAPMALAPLVTNIIAILAQAVPVNLLLSARSSAWGSLGFRALMAATYIALPDNTEIMFGITWAQWPLGLCLVLLVVASMPKTWSGRIFDCIFLLVAGLTGPFSILVSPIAVFLAWRGKERWRWMQCAVLGSCAMIQLWALLILDPKGRSSSPNGITAAILTRILGGDVFAGTLLGRVGLAGLPGTGAFVFLLCVAAGGVAMVAACFLKSRREMKLLLVFACLVFAASLLSPADHVPAGSTVWGVLSKIAAHRYWFVPSVAFAWVLLWCARSEIAILKAAASMLLCLMAFGAGAVFNWRIPPSRISILLHTQKPLRLRPWERS